eukprot:1143517-Pelagomonas_calceolata.AAC.15
MVPVMSVRLHSGRLAGAPDTFVLSCGAATLIHTRPLQAELTKIVVRLFRMRKGMDCSLGLLALPGDLVKHAFHA